MMMIDKNELHKTLKKAADFQDSRSTQLQAQLAAAEAARRAAEARAAQLAGALENLCGILQDEEVSLAAAAIYTMAREVLATTTTAALTADVLRAAERKRDTYHAVIESLEDRYTAGDEDGYLDALDKDERASDELARAVDAWRSAREVPAGGKE